MKVPDSLLAVAGSNSHQLPDRPPLDGDGTIRFLREGKPAFFAQVEVQQKHTDDKYATLRAYHGSEVSKAQVGGHMFVVSPKPAEAAKFRRSESRRGEEYAYRGSYLSRADLEPLAGDGQSFEERCFALGMTDFSQGVPTAAVAMLREAAETDITIANLFFRTITEEVSDVAMMEAVMQDDILEKLRGLKAWRDYEERVEKRGEARAEAKAEARAEVAERAAQARAEAAELAARADALTQFFFMRGDKPSVHALDRIGACSDAGQLNLWLRRAYAGETAAEIFPEPEA
ncbi:MAG: hypothetical protein FWE35_13495 [Streptosporangiales bacterium]|nr:hypothetical protein [Streptosporangiales bacterium]